MTPLPAIKDWEARMLANGAKIRAQALASAPDTVATDGPLDVTFYDGARTFYQIADYTGDPAWNEPAQACAALYRDAIYRLEGKAKGWRIFPHGLYEDYRRTGNERSLEALLLMSKHADFAREGTPFADTENEALSREVAYNINTFLTVLKLGEPEPSRLAPLFEQALSHLDQWFIEESSPDYAPFMFGLTAEALISYYEQVEPDPRIVEGLQRGCDWTWDHCWIEQDQAFWYRLNNQSTAEILNLLIAPAYAWLAKQTGEMRNLERGDQLFTGGMRADIEGGKHFNQNYRWSFAYVAWRAQIAK